MADAMSQISALSRIFQKKDIDCSVVNDHIVGCTGTLKGLLDIPGPHFSHFKETLPLPCDDMPTEKPIEYEGQVVKFSEKCKTEAENCSNRFIRTVTENMTSRFLDADNQEVFKSMAVILNPILLFIWRALLGILRNLHNL